MAFWVSLAAILLFAFVDNGFIRGTRGPNRYGPDPLAGAPATGMTTASDPVALAQALIRCKSVTPAEGGALTLLAERARAGGFTCHRMTMTEPGTPDVENLYARLGTGPRTFALPAIPTSCRAGDERPGRGRHSAARSPTASSTAAAPST